MLFNPHYCIAAVAATTVLIIMYFMKRNYATKRNRIFLIMIFDNLFASAINIATFYTISYPDRYPAWLAYAINILYLFSYNAMAILFLLYVDSVTRIPRLKYPIRIIASIIFSYNFLLLFTSPWTHYAIYFDEMNVYRHGPLMFSLYITAFICVITANILVLLVRKKLNFYQVFSITGFVIFVFTGIVFQLCHPRHVINNFVCSMVLFFLYTALENQAYYLHRDTPCYNRRAFVKTIHQLKKKQKPYVINSIKIENYENIVHNFGMDGGELLSERIAERISHKFGRMAYYIESDSFAVVEDGSKRIKRITDKIISCFDEPFLLEIYDVAHDITVIPSIFQIPIATESIEGYEMTEIIHGLKEYDSKNVTIISDVMQHLEPIRREKEVLRIIDRALENHNFKVYYQPILDVASGKFISSEALIRLIDTEQGFISPEEFIPIAERNGRINEIGKFVFEDVCRFMRNSNVAAFGVHYIEVNLSPTQCQKPELVDSLVQIMKNYGISPSQLNLEITETAEMENHGMDKINHLMQQLHSKGVTFSLDDFGSGFSALNYLIGFPVDIVKIDKGILWQAMKDPTSMTVLRSTIKMIKDVGRMIVVEGVETEEMATILKEYGCDYLQGYLYSKPLPEEEYLKFIAEA